MRDTVMATLIAAALLAGLAAPASAKAKKLTVSGRVTGGILDQGAGRYVTYGELVLGRGLRGGYRARVTQTGDVHRTVHLQRRPWLVLGHERGHDLGRRGRGDRITDRLTVWHRGRARATGTLTETGTTDLTTAFVREEVTGSLTVRPEKRPRPARRRATPTAPPSPAR